MHNIMRNYVMPMHMPLAA